MTQMTQMTQNAAIRFGRKLQACEDRRAARQVVGRPAVSHSSLAAHGRARCDRMIRHDELRTSFALLKTSTERNAWVRRDSVVAIGPLHARDGPEL
jgi:hypothetical protein